MSASILDHLHSITNYNRLTWRRRPLAEISGSLGDLGTLLPLMIAMSRNGSVDFSSTLVFSGLANIFTGIWFGIPLPVQPMKAIAAVAISQNFNQEETAAAGLFVGISVLVLSATGSLQVLKRIVPDSVVKGIQMGAGLSLIISAGTSLLKPLDWTTPYYDNKVIALAAFLFLIVANVVDRIPYALILTLVGLSIATISGDIALGSSTPTFAIWQPKLLVPSGRAWPVGVIGAGLPQLPLTTLNSVLAVSCLAGTLFPDYPPTPSTTSLGVSVGLANVIGCWFGAMPICHGSGGLAGQYRFGARSGASIVLLGAFKLFLGLLVAATVEPLLGRFPKSLLAMMVLAAGVELAKVGHDVRKKHHLSDHVESDQDAPFQYDVQAYARDLTAMLVTVAGCLAFRNDAVGFLAGLLWYWSYDIPVATGYLARRTRSVRLGDDEATTTIGAGDTEDGRR